MVSRATVLRRILPAAFWSALGFAFVMAVLPRPPQPVGPVSDKIQHIVAFAVLAGLAAAAYPKVRLVGIGFGLAAFGALIELVQLIPALGRDGSLMDWVADIAAVAVVLGMAQAVRGFRPPDSDS